MIIACLCAHAADINGFRHTYTDDLSIGSMYVDGTGTTWLGTSEGLMTYRMLNSQEDFALTIPEELRVPIFMMFGMKDNKMAVVTVTNQMYIFDPETYRATSIDDNWLTERGLGDAHSWDLYICSQPYSEAMIAYNNKIYLYDNARSEKAVLIKQMDAPVKSLSMDSDNFFAFTDNDIFVHNLARKTGLTIELPEQVFAGKAISDPHGNIWMGDNDLYRYDSATGEWRQLAENLIVTDIQRSGNDIFVSSNSGLWHYDLDGRLVNKFTSSPMDQNSIINNHVRSLFLDGNRNLWITYWKGGVSILSMYNNLFKTRHIQPLLHSGIKDDVISLCPYGDKYLLVGTDGNGLYLTDLAGNPVDGVLPGLANNGGDEAVTAIFIDSRHRLWIGIYRGGLICHDNGRTTRMLDEISPYSIAEDIDGNIFVGTSGNGLYRIDANQASEPRKVEACDIEWVQQISCNHSSTVLVAGSSDLLAINTRTLQGRPLLDEETIKGPENLKGYETIYCDSRGLVWVTGKEGKNRLMVIDRTNNTILPLGDLEGTGFRSVAEDENKTMWLTTEHDIYNITVNYDQKDKTYTLGHKAYKLKTNERSNISYNYRAACRLPDGSPAFGGNNGFQIVNPLLYTDLGMDYVPEGRLSALKVNEQFIIPGHKYDGRVILNKNLAMTDRIVLSSGQDNVALLFSPRDFGSPFDIEYFYRLDCGNTEWHQINGSIIDLPMLSPGTYNLEVCALSNDGTMSEPLDTLSIKILPPWYRSIAAYIIYAVLILGLIWITVYYYLDRQKQRMRIIQAEQEMERQSQLNEMKLRFFTNISHDFRTPLSLIITPVENYINEHKDSEQSQFLESVHRNAVRLLNLVNQILDFRKLEVTGMPLRVSYGNIVEFVKDICSSFVLFSEDSGISLDTKFEVPSLNMYFDKDKLSKIMMNLLSNAFKYTGDGGSVTVTLAKSDENVSIKVADTGTGIPDKDKPHIFGRFYQADNSNHTRMGCGVGLHIVKEFVELHNGTVTVADNEPRGTVFTVTLPIVKVADNAVIDHEAESAPAPETETGSGRQNLLLVEDNIEFINFMEKALSGDYNIYKANNGRQALDILHSQTIDIVISDVMMDVMDGFELCQTMKSDVRISHIPIILLTARTLAEDELKGLELGADDYITKPFKMAILKQRILKQLDENRRMRTRFQTSPEISPSDVTITSIDEKFLNDAVKAVEDNMQNPDFSVEMLSDSLNMHRSHLYKKLSCLTGKTPIEFIRLIRLKRAKQYLEKSQMYISEIAYKVGFNNPRLFSRYFKEEFNMTPREYIRATGGNDNKR